MKTFSSQRKTLFCKEEDVSHRMLLLRSKKFTEAARIEFYTAPAILD